MILETKMNENRETVSYKYVNYFPIFLFAKINTKSFIKESKSRGYTSERALLGESWVHGYSQALKVQGH